MTDSSISNARREVVRARERMTETIDEIDTGISERVTSAKHKLNVIRFVREHPWSSLGVAVTIGALIGGSGADEKAATAAAAGAKRAARGTADSAKNLAAKVKSRARSANEQDSARARSSESYSSPGLGDRLAAAASAPIGRAIDRLLDEMRVASRDLGERLARSGRSTRTPSSVTVTTVEAVVASRPRTTAPPATVVSAPRAEDVVPVPPEMLPSEVDARADAVESLGGGTHQPPLEPGAGDLGARWA